MHRSNQIDITIASVGWLCLKSKCWCITVARRATMATINGTLCFGLVESAILSSAEILSERRDLYTVWCHAVVAIFHTNRSMGRCSANKQQTMLLPVLLPEREALLVNCRMRTINEFFEHLIVRPANKILREKTRSSSKILLMSCSHLYEQFKHQSIRLKNGRKS
jgi:hypothetical protein